MKPLKIGNLLIPVPIIQGGMGIGVSLSGLASAVANMGGVGVISTVGINMINNDIKQGRNNLDGLRAEIRRARELTSGIIGVNVMTVMSNFSEIVKVSIEEGIDIIFSGAGLPLDLPKYAAKDCKTKLVPIVSSGRAASIICKKWLQNYDYLPDAIVVEGPKAGGHLGFKASELLDKNITLESILIDVIEVINDVKLNYNKEIPVIAAGGIFYGSDIYKFLNLGASAVQLGTRFIATEECDASIEFKNAIINAKESDVQIIKSPVGMPGRAIYNEFLEDAINGNRRPNACIYKCIKGCNPKFTLYCIADALISAYKGNMNNGFVFTGSNVGKVDKMKTVENIFNEIFMEYTEAENNNNQNNI